MNNKLKKVVADVFDMQDNEIDSTFSMDTCASWDSIMHIVLIAEIEYAFEISFSPESIEKIKSIQDIMDFLAQVKSS
jgi:acyl carrier protein